MGTVSTLKSTTFWIFNIIVLFKVILKNVTIKIIIGTVILHKSQWFYLIYLSHCIISSVQVLIYKEVIIFLLPFEFYAFNIVHTFM